MSDIIWHIIGFVIGVFLVACILVITPVGKGYFKRVRDQADALVKYMKSKSEEL